MPDGRFSLLLLGAGSLGVQLVFVREVLSSFGGNELVAGLTLGIWLLLTGLGSLLGGRISSRLPPGPAVFAGHLLLAVLPVAMLAAIRAVPLISGVRGELCGLRTAFFGSLAVFLPFALVSGGMISLLGRILARAQGDEGGAPGRVYLLDSLGSAGGGLLFSLLLISLLSHGWCLALFGGLQLLAAGGVLFVGSLGAGPGRRLSPGQRIVGVAAILLAAIPLCLAGMVESKTMSWRFPGQEILRSRNSPFAQIVITQCGGQKNVFLDALPLYSTGDLQAEAQVHPALSQIPTKAAVLLIGGGVLGNVREAARHDPRRIDLVELDRALLDLGQREGFSDPEAAGGKIHAHVGDGRRFLAAHPGEYDAVIISLPGPENAQLNRFYTEEFFHIVHRALRPDGIFSFSLPATPNYLGPEQLSMERSIYAALSESFAHVTVLPGETHIYLARDAAVRLDLPAVLDARGIVTRRLLDYDWSELSDPFRLTELNRLLAAGPRSSAPPNRDLSPRAFGHLLVREARKTGAGRSWIIVLAALSLLLALAAGGSSPSRLAVGSSGFVGMSAELLILLLDQVRFGHLYQRLSIFVTLFLMGAAFGSAWAPRLGRSARRQVVAFDVLLLILAATLGAAGLMESSAAGRQVPDWVFHLGHPLLLLAIAVVLGAQFAAAGRDPASGPGPVVGRLYLADLSGAASGTILTGLVLLPGLGWGGAVGALLVLKAMSMGFLLRKSEGRRSLP